MSHQERNRAMQAGKLPGAMLAELLSKLPGNERLLVGPGVGIDAAAIQMRGGRVLVASADPITFATERVGQYAVHVNANDVACLGATPAWFMATVLLPEGATADLADMIFEQIRDTCQQMDITPIGGHTEVVHGLHRPIVSGAMLGETSEEELILPANALAGDHIVLTKGIAIEGTALLALEAEASLRGKGVEQEIVASAAALLDAPGISIVEDAVVARAAGEVRALHDVTEGGLSGALYELAAATGRSVHVRLHDVRILDETRALAGALNLDPLGLLASGSLLIVLAEQDCPAICDALSSAGVGAACIGNVARDGALAIIDENGNQLPRFDRDEAARFLDTLVVG